MSLKMGKMLMNRFWMAISRAVEGFLYLLLVLVFLDFSHVLELDRIIEFRYFETKERSFLLKQYMKMSGMIGNNWNPENWR